MVRIAHVIDHLAGGAARTIAQLCGGLDSDHRSTIFFSTADDSGRTLWHPDGVTPRDWFAPARSYGEPKLHPLPATDRLRFFKNVRYLRERLADRFDVVHGHGVAGGLCIKALAEGAGSRAGGVTYRTIYSPHGYPFVSEDRWAITRAACRFIECRSAHRVTTVAGGPHERSLATSLGGEVLQINNASRLIAPPPVDQLNDTVLGIGQRCRRKGFDRFLDVARRLPHRRFDWIGRGPQPMSRRFGRLPQNVRLLDHLPGGEVLDRISRCRMILLPSRWEGLSRVLVEAACGGKAIVTSRYPANLDCLRGSGGCGEAGAAGWNANGFASDSVDELAGAVERLSDDGRLLSEMQAASSQIAAERFDWQHRRRQWNALYRGQTVGNITRIDQAASAGGRTIAGAVTVG